MDDVAKIVWEMVNRWKRSAPNIRHSSHDQVRVLCSSAAEQYLFDLIAPVLGFSTAYNSQLPTHTCVIAHPRLKVNFTHPGELLATSVLYFFVLIVAFLKPAFSN